MTIAKSTVMRTEVEGRQVECRADRNISHDGKTRLDVRLHMVKDGVGLGTVSGSSFAELGATLQAMQAALEQLRQADGGIP